MVSLDSFVSFLFLLLLTIESNNMSGGGEKRAEEITQSLPVPENKIGWIVGKRGSYINQLCKKSGAQIEISESTSREYGMIWKYIQITGTGRAVDRAKKLIHIRLERLAETKAVKGDSREDRSGSKEDGGGDEMTGWDDES